MDSTVKYQHELEVYYAICHLENKFKSIGIEVDTRFLDYFSFCPRCKSDFKVYNNTLKGLASVSAYLLLEQNKAVLYGICKKCARKLSNSIEQNSRGDITENNIVSVIPDLQRKMKASKEEKEKEFAIFESL